MQVVCRQNKLIRCLSPAFIGVGFVVPWFLTKSRFAAKLGSHHRSELFVRLAGGSLGLDDLTPPIQTVGEL